jgi:hypothetical protein
VRGAGGGHASESWEEQRGAAGRQRHWQREALARALVRHGLLAFTSASVPDPYPPRRRRRKRSHSKESFSASPANYCPISSLDLCHHFGEDDNSRQPRRWRDSSPRECTRWPKLLKSAWHRLNGREQRNVFPWTLAMKRKWRLRIMSKKRTGADQFFSMTLLST